MKKFNNLIYNNAYGILGLSSDAKGKEITKRFKEIEKILKIEKVQKYELDFDIYVKNRTLENVNIAYKELQLEERKIYHCFFACDSSKNQQEKNNIIKRTIKLFESNNNSLITVKDIINTWKFIIENDENIENFKNRYLLIDNIGVDKENLFRDFKKKAIDELCLIFSDVSQSSDEVNKSIIVKYFIEKFNIENNNFNFSQIDEVYEIIYATIDDLNKLNISEDGIFDDKEKATLKDSIRIFKECFEKLKDFGVYETSKAKLVRDNVAECLRNHSVDLCNNLKEYKEALVINDFLILTAGTDGLKNKLINEKDVISHNIGQDSLSKKPLNLPLRILGNQIIIAKYVSCGEYSFIENLLLFLKNFDREVYDEIIVWINKKYNLTYENGQIKKNSSSKGCLMAFVIWGICLFIGVTLDINFLKGLSFLCFLAFLAYQRVSVRLNQL